MTDTTPTKPDVSKHFTSSILLWMRTDKPRQEGMDRWKGPHSGIIAATPGLFEYRQIHLAEHNPGRWPDTSGVETAIPADRKIDGIAEVTFENALSPLSGRKQTALAFEDEVNIFRRTLLHAGPPGTSRWYDVAPGYKPGSRAIIYLRRGADEGSVAFHKFLKKQLTPALIATGALTELRTQVFLPWNEKTWDTPNVAHDNPADQHLNASVILGFTDDRARDRFYTDHAPDLSTLLAPHVAAVHAYDVTDALTYVNDSQILPHYEN
ncbi:strictosidine synthase [Microbacterium sp. 22303]|uniref:strictosidine synthase n=1 Tax=Microbacterium sp. 22303 TaxID=3453905 RepID=UPI003F837F75